MTRSEAITIMLEVCQRHVGTLADHQAIEEAMTILATTGPEQPPAQGVVSDGVDD